jgi:hypothetical protein
MKDVPFSNPQRLSLIRTRFEKLSALVNHRTYTTVEAMIDTFHWMLNGPLKKEYLGFLDHDERKFINDVSWVMGGFDAEQSLLSYAMGRLDQRFMAPTRVLYPTTYSGFKSELNDSENTIRHIIYHLAVGYHYGDTAGNIGAFTHDPPFDKRRPLAVRDRNLGYAGADLGEEMDDAFEIFGGWDLDDFPRAFAEYFADSAAQKRSAERYAW